MKIRNNLAKFILWAAAIGLVLLECVHVFRHSIDIDERFLFNAGRIVFDLPEFQPQFVTWSTVVAGALLKSVQGAAQEAVQGGVQEAVQGGVQGHAPEIAPFHFENLFWIFRLAVVLVWGYCLAAFARVNKLSVPATFITFAAVAILHPMFIPYFHQARYDSFIHIFLIAQAVLFRLDKETSTFSAFIFYLMTFSGMKGVYYAAGFLIALFVRYWRLRSVSGLRAFALKVATLWIGTVILFYSFGRFESLVETYTFHIMAKSSHAGSDNNLAITIEREAFGVLFYWIGALSLVVYVRSKMWKEHADLNYLSLTGAMALIYCLIHPRIHLPMLNPLQSALALTTVVVVFSKRQELFSLFSSKLIVVTSALVLAIQVFLNPLVEQDPREYMHSYDGVGYLADPQKDFGFTIPPSAKVYDPSSHVLVGEPCVKEWYLDLMFNDLRVAGHWQKNLDLNKCDFVVLKDGALFLDPAAVSPLFENFYEIGDGSRIFRNKRKQVEQ